MKTAVLHGLLLAIGLTACGVLRAEVEPGRTLAIGVSADPPFVQKTANGFSGFSIDLWKAIAADQGWKYEFRETSTIPDLISGLEKHDLDVCARELFITKDRLGRVDFSHPYLDGGLQVMINEKREHSLGHLLRGLYEGGHLEIFAVGGAIILLCTFLLTLGERRWNEEFPKGWADGLADSFYHVMSISMTGKSNHKGLPGPFGRVLAGLWLAAGVGIVAYITSSVTSVMTVNKLRGQINGPGDLPGHVVGTLEGSVGQQYCTLNQLNAVAFSTVEKAVDALVNKQVQAVVYDAAMLQWYDNAHPELPITEVGSIFDEKSYGFAMPQGSPLRPQVNISLLKLKESGFVDTLKKQYFGNIQ